MGSAQLLLNSKIRKPASKNMKCQQSRIPNALLWGLVSGFIFSYFAIFRNRNFTIDVPQNANLAEFLYHKVRILCIMMPIDKKALEESGEIFLKTWTKRCQKFIFFADEPHDEFKDNIIVLSNKENYWERLKEALTYIYKYHLNDFDWILKTNDNTYVVMENLRWLLFQYEIDWPVVIGQRHLMEDHMTGVYVLSKSTFSHLVENLLNNPDMCDSQSVNDDLSISKCLQQLKIYQIDPLDDEDKGMFFRENPENALLSEEKQNYLRWSWYKSKQAPNTCCSERIIAIQNVHNTSLYYLEYFIYKVHAFGRHRLAEPLPARKGLNQIIKEIF